jgi:hypothetical protein
LPKTKPEPVLEQSGMALGGLSTCRGLASHVSHLSQTHQFRLNPFGLRGRRIRHGQVPQYSVQAVAGFSIPHAAHRMNHRRPITIDWKIASFDLLCQAPNISTIIHGPGIAPRIVIPPTSTQACRSSFPHRACIGRAASLKV